MNALIVYFSHRQENYVSGNMVNLKEGNTEVVAKKLQSLLDCPIFEIETVHAYPYAYSDTTALAKIELENNVKVPLKTDIDLEQYDTLYIGYPNWWGTMLRAVFTFLESHDLHHKMIYPFCTHEGSHIGDSVKDLKNSCCECIVNEGLAIFGSKVTQCDDS